MRQHVIKAKPELRKIWSRWTKEEAVRSLTTLFWLRGPKINNDSHSFKHTARHSKSSRVVARFEPPHQLLGSEPHPHKTKLVSKGESTFGGGHYCLRAGVTSSGLDLALEGARECLAESCSTFEPK